MPYQPPLLPEPQQQPSQQPPLPQPPLPLFSLEQYDPLQTRNRSYFSMWPVSRREQVCSTIAWKEFEEWLERVHSEPTGESSDAFDRSRGRRRAAFSFVPPPSMIPFRNTLKFYHEHLSALCLFHYQDYSMEPLRIQSSSFWTDLLLRRCPVLLLRRLSLLLPVLLLPLLPLSLLFLPLPPLQMPSLLRRTFLRPCLAGLTFYSTSLFL